MPQRKPVPRTSSTGELISTRCDLVSKGPTFQQTHDFLVGKGFEVTRVDVPGPRNRVVEVTPCQAPKGSTITVKVGNGQRPTAPASSGSPDDNGNGGGNGNGNGGGGGVSVTPSFPGLPGTN